MPLIKTALIYFNQAIRDGSIRKAADNLHIASSAINRQLLQLEAEMGTELFVRLPRGIRPTAAGEALLSCIRRWDREASHLVQEIGRLKGGVRGTVRIAAAESLTEDILPRALKRMRDKYPLVDCRLTSGDNYHIRSELLAREADLVCAFDVADAGPATTVLSIEAAIGVMMPPDHPLAAEETITLAQCLPHPIVAPETDWLAHSVLRDLIERDRMPLRIVARVERISMLHNLVEAGIGIAFLARIGLERHIDAGRIVWRPLAAGTIKPATVSILVPRGVILPPYVTTLTDLLSEELRAVA